MTPLRAAALLSIPTVRRRVGERALLAYAAGDVRGGNELVQTRDELARIVILALKPAPEARS